MPPLLPGSATGCYLRRSKRHQPVCLDGSRDRHEVGEQYGGHCQSERKMGRGYRGSAHRVESLGKGCTERRSGISNTRESTPTRRGFRYLSANGAADSRETVDRAAYYLLAHCGTTGCIHNSSTAKHSRCEHPPMVVTIAGLANRRSSAMLRAAPRTRRLPGRRGRLPGVAASGASPLGQPRGTVTRHPGRSHGAAHHLARSRASFVASLQEILTQ
jgi:hypothetical protein